MRCLLEQAAGAPQVGLDEEVNNLFGITESKTNHINNQPSKLIVRDAMLSDDSKKALLASDNLDMPYTENKFENVIDRVRGVAEHPRQTERVPAGAVFNAEFIINICKSSSANWLRQNSPRRTIGQHKVHHYGNIQSI